MAEDGATPAYTRSFWGKSRRGDPSDFHLLEHQLADVGACFEALLAQPANIAEFSMDLFVDGTSYCNPNRIYGDEGTFVMGCESEKRRHGRVERVSAQTHIGDLRCERSVWSSATRTDFACEWR